MHKGRGADTGDTGWVRRTAGLGRGGTCGFALLVALLGGTPTPTWAAAVRVEPPRVISAPSPVPHRCAGDSAEGESSLAVDPRHPSRLVAAWMQDTSRSNVNAAAASSDGGRSWTPVAVPGITRCTSGRNEVAEDPSTSLGPDGAAYLSSLVAPPNTVQEAISASGDGGYHWGKPLRLDTGDDFPQLVADPTVAGRAYVAYSNYTGFCLPGQCVPVTGRVNFSRTVDGGRSFSSPTVVRAVPPETFVLSRLLELTDGSLVDVYGEAPVAAVVTGSGTLAVHAVRSTDIGRTWSSPVSVGAVPLTNVTDPDNGNVLIPHCCPFAVAAGPHGLAYVAWADIASNSTRLRLVRSADHGRSWSAPLTAATIAAQAFDPALAIARGGTVGLTWYDFRHDRAGDSQLTTDVWFAHSHDRGARFRQVHLAGPFDMRDAPTAGAPAALGDYDALAAMPHGFGASFAQAKPRAKDGPSDVFFARIRLVGRRPRLRLSVRPKTAYATRRTRFVFRVTTLAKRGTHTARTAPVVDALIELGGRQAHTDRHGYAAIELTFRRRGRHKATAAKPGYARASTRVRVLSDNGCREPDYDNDCDRRGQTASMRPAAYEPGGR